MVMHSCDICKYKTQYVHNLRRHVQRHTVDKINDVVNPLICDWCLKVFSTKGNCIRHKNGRCASQPKTDEDVQNVDRRGLNVDASGSNVDSSGSNVDSLGSIVDSKKQTELVHKIAHPCPTCIRVFDRPNKLECHKAKCKGMLDACQCPKCHLILSSRSSKSHHIKRCTVTPQPLTVINNTTNNTTINNIQTQNNNYNIILNFGHEDTQHMSPEFLTNASRMRNGAGILAYIKELHFNTEHPQNHNLRLIDGERDTTLAVRKNDKWYAMDHVPVFHGLIQHVKFFLIDFVHSMSDRIPLEDKVIIIKSLQDIDSVKNSQSFNAIRRGVLVAMRALSKVIADESLHWM